MKFFFFLFIVLALVCAGGYFFKQDAIPVLPDPPEVLSFKRSAMWPEYVAQITNTHSSTIQVNLRVVNDDTNQKETWTFPVASQKEQEIGVLETGWHFDPGEHGYVQVQGYTKKLYFKLLQKDYFKMWFSI